MLLCCWRMHSMHSHVRHAPYPAPQGLSRRAFVVCDPVRSVTTSTVTLGACGASHNPLFVLVSAVQHKHTHHPTEDRISLDEAVPANPKSKLITGIRKTLFATRECTYALRQMDIPWDTSDTKAVEKFVLDYQAVRVKVCCEGFSSVSIPIIRYTNHTTTGWPASCRTGNPQGPPVGAQAGWRQRAQVGRVGV